MGGGYIAVEAVAHHTSRDMPHNQETYFQAGVRNPFPIHSNHRIAAPWNAYLCVASARGPEEAQPPQTGEPRLESAQQPPWDQRTSLESRPDNLARDPCMGTAGPLRAGVRNPFPKRPNHRTARSLERPPGRFERAGAGRKRNRHRTEDLALNHLEGVF
eukprot:gene19227-biopygen20514